MKWGKIAQLENLADWLGGRRLMPAAAMANAKEGEAPLSDEQRMDLAGALIKIINDYKSGVTNLKEVNIAYKVIKPDLARFFHPKRALPNKIVLRGE